MKVRGVILAAGLGQRMGTIKQLLPLQGKPLLQHVLDAAGASMLSHLTLILGHAHEIILSQIEPTDVSVIINKDFAVGQSTSLRAGLEHGPDSSGVMFLLGDQPLISADFLNHLIDIFVTTRPVALMPVYQGQPGNPVILGRKLGQEARGLHGDMGARPLLQRYAPLVRKVEIHDPHLLQDVDTPEAYQALLEKTQAIFQNPNTSKG